MLKSVIIFLLLMAGSLITFQLIYYQPKLQPDVPGPVQEHFIMSLHPSKVFTVISVDPQFDQFEFSLINEAVYNWEFYTNDLAKFKIVTGDPLANKIEEAPGQQRQAVLIRALDSHDFKTFIIDVLIGGTTLGYYDDSTFIPTIWIVVDRIQDEDEFIAVIMHELGHSIGLQHTLHNPSLMYQYVDGSVTCLTQYDLKKFCKIYGCNSEEMNYCYFNTEGPACLNDEEYDLNLKK